MNRWHFYTSSELKPRGWIRRQLEIQAEGLSGHLDQIWPDVRDSAWIGGPCEGWERVPYWLDGFIPLAYLLEDEDKIARAKKYIDAILAYQKEDGWICPCADDARGSYDTWAVQLITKVLVVYYECSGDERIPDAVYRVLKNYYELLRDGTVRLFDWGKFRWFEAMIAIDFVYRRTPEPWLKELAQILREQGENFEDHVERWKRPLNQWRYDTHIVNAVMMLKAEAVSCDLLGEPYTDRAEYFYDILSRYNGMAVGTFTGDECLSGLSPIQGTELCAVVEQMYSYELLYAYTGDPKWAERLEVIAFNALPATISEDMWTHQYLQMSNQIACQYFPGKPIFRTNSYESHLFGLEPNYGCCTANFSQGWPKLALTAFLHRGAEILSALPLPSELDTRQAYVRLDTNYPFENRMTYTVCAREDVTLRVRVPGHVENLTVNGEAARGEELTFAIPAGEQRVLQIDFDTQPRFEQRPHGLSTVRWGSLVFAVPIAYKTEMHEFERNGVERKFPYCDYEYVPVSPWNYAYCAPTLAVEERGVGECPFSGSEPPVVVKARVKPIDWGYEDGYDTVCAKVPQSLEPLGEARELELYPYGCARLRMTELPIIE